MYEYHPLSPPPPLEDREEEEEEEDEEEDEEEEEEVEKSGMSCSSARAQRYSPKVAMTTEQTTCTSHHSQASGNWCACVCVCEWEIR